MSAGQKKDTQCTWGELPIIAGIQPDHYGSYLSNFGNRYSQTFYKSLMEVAGKIITRTTGDVHYFFLTGSCGSGKTHWMAGTYRCRVCADHGVTGAGHAMYTQYSGLINEIISGFKDGRNAREQLEAYLAVDTLFLDDISYGGKISIGDKLEAQMFTEILLDRFEKNKYLVATSNYSSTELKRMLRTSFGDYIMSRIESSALFLEFPNKDFRVEGRDDHSTGVRKDSK